MAGVPRRKPPKSALPEENDWVAERERLDQADAASGAGDQQPAEGPTPQRPSAGPGAPSAPDLPRPTLKLPSTPTAGDVGGFLFGLTLYALFINYLRFGPLGVKGWLRAKFMNAPLDLRGAAIAPLDSGSGSVDTSSSSIDTGPVAPLSQEA